MFRIFYAEKDATLYESAEYANTGIDEILEISTFESINDTNEVSRALIKFPTSEINLAMGLVSSSVSSDIFFIKNSFVCKLIILSKFLFNEYELILILHITLA